MPWGRDLQGLLTFSVNLITGSMVCEKKPWPWEQNGHGVILKAQARGGLSVREVGKQVE